MRPIRHNPGSLWFWVGGLALVGGLAYVLGRKGVGSYVGKTVVIPFGAIKAVENTGLSAMPAGASVDVQVTADDGTTVTGTVVSVNGLAMQAGASIVVQFLDSAITGTV